MKKQIVKRITGLMSGLFLLSATAWAMDNSSGHGDHGGHKMDHQTTSPLGHEIASKKVDNYTFRYVLLDLAQRNQAMKGMEGMEMPGMSTRPDITNHLVVTILDPDQKPVSAKVGFILTDPSGHEFKTLTMGMSGGYGADLVLKTPGVYRIKTKAVIGDKALMDVLDYSVK